MENRFELWSQGSIGICIFLGVMEGAGRERGTWKKMAIWDTCEPTDSGLRHQQHLEDISQKTISTLRLLRDSPPLYMHCKWSRCKSILFSKILVLCSRESRRQPNAASTTSWDIWTGKTIHCLNGDDTAVWFDLSIFQSFPRQVLNFKRLTSWWLKEKHIGHFAFCFFHLVESDGFKKQWKMKLFISCPGGSWCQ